MFNRFDRGIIPTGNPGKESNLLQECGQERIQDM